MLEMTAWNKEYLDALVALWNREMGEDFPMRKELFIQNSFEDVNILWDGSKIALDDSGNVIGFVVSKCFQDDSVDHMPDKTGWIQALVVDTRSQGQGVGTYLLEHAEASLRGKGMQQILLGRDTYHYFPGVPLKYEKAAQWFTSKGYDKQKTYHDLICSYDMDEVKKPSISGVHFEWLAADEHETLLTFMHRCFPGRWEYEAKTYFQAGGTGREFVVMKRADKIIGFCRVNDADSPIIAQNVYWAPLFAEEMGGIGPLGIDSAERGQGLGLAIVKAGIATLRERGITNIVIDWTDLVDFYKKLGYSVWKSYDSYQKEIS